MPYQTNTSVYLKSNDIVPLIQLDRVILGIGISSGQQLLVTVIEHPQLPTIRILIQHVAEQISVGTDFSGFTLQTRSLAACP